MKTESAQARPVVDQRDLLVVYGQSAETARMNYELLAGQEAVQRMFVNIRDLVDADRAKAQEGIRGVYNGEAAVLEIVECFADNTDDSRGIRVSDHMRLIISGEADDGNGLLLCDLAATRPRKSESWEVQVGDYAIQTTRNGGNPGIHWRTVSGLVSGEDRQPMGLSPEVRGVINMVQGILESQTKK